MIAVGIDLGASKSSIGYRNDHGHVALIPDVNDAQQFLTPSVVGFLPDRRVIGQEVWEHVGGKTPIVVAEGFKHLVGDVTTPAVHDPQGRAWSARALTALLLRKLRRDAEFFTDEQIGSVVLTVPSHFTDRQRRAAIDSARLAGLPLPQLVDEPVAAAIYYGMEHPAKDTILLVYDLGGGSFDVSVLHASKDGLCVLATEGANDIGGRHFDALLSDLIAGQFRAATGHDPRPDAHTARILRREAEKLKIRLASPSVAEVRQFLSLAGRTAEILVTRAQLDALIEPSLERSIALTEQCLLRAALRWPGVDRILLSGGASLLPSVPALLRKVSGRLGSDVILQQPHQAVGFGAARLASRATPSHSADAPSSSSLDILQNVATCDLGLAVRPRPGEPPLRVLIPRNTPLPAEATATVFTHRPDQTRVIVQILQSRGNPPEFTSLGHFAFGPIAHPRKNYPIEVRTSYNLNGLVVVTARDPETGQRLEQAFTDEDRAAEESLLSERELVG